MKDPVMASSTTPESAYDAAQTRGIVEQVVRTLKSEESHKGSHSVTQDEVKEIVMHETRHSESRIRNWIMGTVLAQAVALIPMTFFMGSIYSDGKQAVEMLTKQAVTQQNTDKWMAERERWEVSMEVWAVREGFIPPKHRSLNADR